MRKASRTAIILLLIASLLVTAAAQRLAQARRAHAIYGERAPAEAARSSLGSMDSFALALLLGGLRGPLVMVLWASSETQKAQKDLEDFDTKVEWIRLLQPEFDSVHIFQVWNKAYNISVQMASVANRYLTILDAIDYAKSVDRQRPDDINILCAIAQVYFDKLGKAYESPYYRKRVRLETQAPSEQEQAQAAQRRASPTWRRLRLDPLLDRAGRILPELASSELPHLARYEPFSYGISPFALAYNYHKRAQLLQQSGQKHIQFGTAMVDSRPALDLEYWANEEVDRTRSAELRAVGKPVPAEIADQLSASSLIALADQVVDVPAYQEVQFGYQRALHLMADSLAEYQRHLRDFPDTYHEYLGHISELQLQLTAIEADARYWTAMTAVGAQRQAALQQAQAGYRQAAATYLLVAVSGYLQAESRFDQALPRGYALQNLRELPAAQLSAALARIHMIITAEYGGRHPAADELKSYEQLAERALHRLGQLQRQLATTTGE